jgi:hypothetical protein
MIDSPSTPVPAVRPDPVSSLRGSPATSITPVAGSYHVRESVDQTITPNDYPRLISLVRALIPDAGTARELGDGLQWEHDSGFTSLSLTINPEPSGTVIRADLQTDGEQVAWFLGAGIVGILSACVAVTAHLGLGGIIGTGLGTIAASGWCARLLWRRSTRKQAARLEGAVARIAAGLRGELD